MSRARKQQKRPNPPYVSVDVCQSRHEALGKQLESLTAQLKTVTNALVGEDLQGGLVKAVAEIKSKLQMGAELKDWIRPIIIAIVSAAVTAALMKVFHI